MQPSKKLTRQLSIAAGLLSFVAFVISMLGDTWGFEKSGMQIAQTCTGISGAINLFFLGVTSYKNMEDKEKTNEKS